MTEQQFRQKVEEIFHNVNQDQLYKRMDKVLNAGCIDLEHYEDSYLLPKIFITAFFLEMAYQFEPIAIHDKKEVKNISLFIWKNRKTKWQRYSILAEIIL